MGTSIETFHQNAFDLFGSTSQEERTDRVKFFLPPVSNPDAQTQVKTMSVSTIMSENGPVYQFSVSWNEPSKKTEKKWKEKYSTTLDSSITKSEMSVVGLKKSKSRVKSNGTVKCDGPCQKEVGLINVAQFGCDHLICDDCLKTQRSAPLFDGSPGCCNSDCVKIAKYSGEKLRAGPTVSTQSSNISMNGPWESLNIHVSLLKKVGKNVIRTNLQYEFSSQSRVSSLVKTLYTYCDLIKEARFYYCPRKPQSRADLNSIALNETNLRFYDLIDLSSTYISDLYFIIAGKGVHL